jgi:hypothetical protein
MPPCVLSKQAWKLFPEGEALAHNHLIAAYVVTWVLQLGYVGWIASKWLSVRRQEKQLPSYRGN